MSGEPEGGGPMGRWFGGQRKTFLKLQTDDCKLGAWSGRPAKGPDQAAALRAAGTRMFA